MKAKVTVILKNGIKYEKEYVCNDIKNKKVFEENLINNLESESDGFYIIGDNRVDLFLKDEISHISIEYIN